MIIGLPLLLAMMLAGCSRSDADDAAGQSSLATAAQRGRSPFGAGFDKASHASPNSEPMNVVESDLVPVDPHGEPVPIE